MSETKSILPGYLKDNMPEAVFRKVSEMDELNQAAYIGEFKKKKKSTLVGYLLLGGGVHYMYLGKFWLFLLFIFTGGGCLVWFLIDLFRIPSMVRTYNKTIALDVLRDIQILQ